LLQNSTRNLELSATINYLHCHMFTSVVQTPSTTKFNSHVVEGELPPTVTNRCQQLRILLIL